MSNVILINKNRKTLSQKNHNNKKKKKRFRRYDIIFAHKKKILLEIKCQFKLRKQMDLHEAVNHNEYETAKETNFHPLKT